MQNEKMQIIGGIFLMFSQGKITKEELDKIEEFNEAYDSGNLKGFFLSLINSGKYSSSFKKKPYYNIIILEFNCK